MDANEILAGLGLATASGFLIGLERGWRKREESEGDRTAGLRTFTLIGLSGGLWAALVPALGPVPLAAGFLAMAAIVGFFRWKEAEREGTVGATTMVAACLTFAIGAYAVVGDRGAAAAAAVATAALLAAKGWLHDWLRAISWEELRATLVLLAMSFILLPVLPDAAFGPYDALNPRSLWQMTIAIAGVSFIGYIAVKVGGARTGALLGGIAGGLVSSTAATVDFAHRARRQSGLARLQLAGALAASATMFVRVGAITALFGPALFAGIGAAVGVAAAVLLAAAVLIGAPWRGDEETPEAQKVRNPFDLRVVFGFAAILAAVIVLSKFLLSHFGGEGGILLGAIGGLADVDAITLSMTQAGSAATAPQAELAILVAVTANSASKSAMAIGIGGWRFGGAYAALTLLALAAGGAAALLTAA
ncbi:MAG TPA: DUF4010 domain-containing protein [Bauldia sp.]|nr:DUF4010 domain-containing protein [Bauldia sp.]